MQITFEMGDKIVFLRKCKSKSVWFSVPCQCFGKAILKITDVEQAFGSDDALSVVYHNIYYYIILFVTLFH